MGFLGKIGGALKGAMGAASIGGVMGKALSGGKSSIPSGDQGIMGATKSRLLPGSSSSPTSPAASPSVASPASPSSEDRFASDAKSTFKRRTMGKRSVSGRR